jgi:hypothetical protein
MTRIRFASVLFAAILAAFPVRADEPASLPPAAIDLEFAAAVESFVACTPDGAIPADVRVLLDALDGDRYANRQEAGKTVLSRCSTSILLRARALERRSEVRYWLNRTLRDLNHCAVCDGAGYCTEYRPESFDPAQPKYVGVPCLRCKRFEWQHGWAWQPGDHYGYLPCENCAGSGTYWNHYAVE